MGSAIYCACFTERGEKAEGVMRRLGELGFAETSLGQGEGAAGCCVAFVKDVHSEAIAAIAELSRQMHVIAVLTAPEDQKPDARWEILGAGAGDALDGADEQTLAEQIAARVSRLNDIEQLAEGQALRSLLVGHSPTWRMLKRKLVEVAAYSPANALLLGETGTGKEQIAKAIHLLDRRASKSELVVVDCTTLSPELSGSELFGHERGAFTGAVSARDGAFSLAHGGTLLLDEIGELSLPLQAQLLRVIQERTYKRVGGNVWHRTEFRLICATNRDLEGLVKQGAFRGDLYYRIADWVLRPPPLRERRADILVLARHFLTLARNGAAVPEFDKALADYLVCRDYPGNVRDLRRLVMRLHSRHVGSGPITIGAIPIDDRPGAGGPPEPWGEPGFLDAIQRGLDRGIGLKEIGRAVANTAIRLSLEQESGNLQRAARRLGITDRALQMRRANEGNGSAESRTR